jgi:hypothetical protein
LRNTGVRATGRAAAAARGGGGGDTASGAADRSARGTAGLDAFPDATSFVRPDCARADGLPEDSAPEGSPAAPTGEPGDAVAGTAAPIRRAIVTVSGRIDST